MLYYFKEYGFLKPTKRSLKKLSNPSVRGFDDYSSPSGLERMIDLQHANTGISTGSINFAGLQSSNIWAANDVDLRMGTSDFTVEWFQYQIEGNPYSRIFSIGTWPTASFGVSIEGDTDPYDFYLWVTGNDDFYSLGSYQIGNGWHHFAVSRVGINIKCFMDGNQIGDTISSYGVYNLNDSTNILRIGGESTPSNNSSYHGYITNFRWTKGTAVYMNNFTVPTVPLSVLANTKLLLLATDAANLVTDTALGKTVTNNGTTFKAAF